MALRTHRLWTYIDLQWPSDVLNYFLALCTSKGLHVRFNTRYVSRFLDPDRPLNFIKAVISRDDIQGLDIEFDSLEFSYSKIVNSIADSGCDSLLNLRLSDDESGNGVEMPILFPNLRSLNLHLVRPPKNTPLILPKLVFLKIEGCSWNDFEIYGIFSASPLLEDISICHDEPVLKRVFDAEPKLDADAKLITMSQLRRLDFRSRATVKLFPLLELITTPSITSIALRYLGERSYRTQESSLLSIAQCLLKPYAKELSHIDMENRPPFVRCRSHSGICYDIQLSHYRWSDHTAVELLQELITYEIHHLTSLDIQDETLPACEAWETIFREFNHLEFLGIHSRDSQLLEVLEALFDPEAILLPKLKTLDVTGVEFTYDHKKRKPVLRALRNTLKDRDQRSVRIRLLTMDEGEDEEEMKMIEKFVDELKLIGKDSQLTQVDDDC